MAQSWVSISITFSVLFWLILFPVLGVPGGRLGPAPDFPPSQGQPPAVDQAHAVLCCVKALKSYAAPSREPSDELIVTHRRPGRAARAAGRRGHRLQSATGYRLPPSANLRRPSLECFLAPPSAARPAPLGRLSARPARRTSRSA